MSGTRMIYVGIVSILVTVAYFGWKFTARSAYESAEYSVLDSDGSFEVRKYEDLMLVTTGMRFQSQGGDGSFMRLFRYIDGGNQANQKIAMTTPVFMERESAAAQGPGQMGFVLPKTAADKSIPKPNSDAVQIRKRDGGRYAAVRFAGRIDVATIRKQEAQLRAWMKKRELVGDGAAEIAGYDPPWTPGPLRRNEVLIRLK